MATIVTPTLVQRDGDRLTLVVEFNTGGDIIIKHYGFSIDSDVTLVKVKALLKAERDRIDALTTRAAALQTYVGVPMDVDS